MEPFFPPDFGLYRCKESSVHGTISSVVVSQNIISSVILLCCLWTRFLPPDLCLYKCKEFSLHGSISSVVFQNIIIHITAVVLEIRFPPPDFCLFYNNCKDLEFRVCLKLFTRMITEKENMCIPDGIKNAGRSLLYIGVL